MVRKIVFSFILVFSLSQISAQEITPQGIFHGDSVKIGEAINYSLTIKYPKDWQVIFPDSTYDYFPFEFYSKRYFPTKTDSISSFDSVVYSISTFEIDLVQKLQIPLFIVNAGDSIALKPPLDSIYLKEMISQLPDSIKFIANVEYHPVEYIFNYPYFIIGSMIFIALAIGTFLLFGKNIRAKIELYRLNKKYKKFTENFETGINKIKANEDNQKIIEEILVIWKKYMESIENRPFTKYTSKEIVKAGYGEGLKNVLQNIDRSIYGNISDQEMHKNFESLEDFTLDRYQLKLKEVSNG